MKKSHPFAWLFFILSLQFNFSTPTFATLPSDETLDFFHQNGVYYYNTASNEDNPDAFSCASSTALNGNSTPEKIWNFFVEHGFSDAQTAGILGNIKAESDFSLTASDSGNYWGLFQWGGGRKDALFQKISAAGLLVYTNPSYWRSSQTIPSADAEKLLLVELNFALSEQDMHWQQELKSTQNPEEAAEIFLVLFERAVGGSSPVKYYRPFSGINYQATGKRRDFSKEFFQTYAGQGKTITKDEQCLSASGDFKQLVLSYAWPNYHPAPFLERKKAYAQAVNQSLREGRYAGGSVDGIPGIDCGGFVTILVQNSGLDPNYNGAKGSTRVQEPWAKAHGWQRLNPNGAIDTAKLQAGDVAFTNGHTFIYVGEISGFNSRIASASISFGDDTWARAPMAGKEDLIYGNGGYARWYRKIK